MVRITEFDSVDGGSSPSPAATLWTVRKTGRGRYSRVETVWEGPELAARAHAELLNQRFAPEYVYWAQRPTDYVWSACSQRRSRIGAPSQ